MNINLEMPIFEVIDYCKARSDEIACELDMLEIEARKITDLFESIAPLYNSAIKEQRG